jgi:hypothetical protein
MIHYLLLYQFPFLYCTTIGLGLVVYGSDFDDLAGRLYLVPLFFLPVLHWFSAKLIIPLSSIKLATALLVSGALVALLAYKKLHFAYWDEHSLSQAVLLVVLGVLSYTVSLIASIRLQTWQGDHRKAGASAWLVLGLCWLLAFYFPMSPLFIIAATMAVASLWPVANSSVPPALQQNKLPVLRPIKYLVFVVAMDLGLVLWDYQVNTGWAWHLSAAFIAASFGSWIAYSSTNNKYWTILAVAVLNFIAAVLWPAYVLQYLHSAVVGFCLGWSINYLANFQSKFSPILVVSSAMPFFLGLSFGNLFYANLAYAQWRLVFLVPLLALLLVYHRNRVAMPSR